MTDPAHRAEFERIFGTTGSAVLERIRAHSPRLVEHVYGYIAGNLYQDQTLDLRTRELGVIAALAAQGGLGEQLGVHVTTALRNGVSPAEIVAAIETVATDAGIPRALNALFIAIPLFESPPP